MKSKSLIGILIIGCVAAFTWVVGIQVGTSVLHGKAQFSEWRTHHVAILVVIWLVSVVVISLPILYVVGRRMLAAMTEHEESVAASRGVGRLAIRALQGKTDAADKLVLLLKDPTPAVRYQAARALAFLDDDDINPTLFKVVRYWTGKDKMALIDTLRRTQDVRCGKLLMELSHDRSPNVSRHAMRALPMVMGRTWRGPTKEEAEQASQKRGGSRVTSGTVPSVMADLPSQSKEREERPLISATPRRTKPVAKPAAAADGVAAARPAREPAAGHAESAPAAEPPPTQPA